MRRLTGDFWIGLAIVLAGCSLIVVLPGCGGSEREVQVDPCSQCNIPPIVCNWQTCAECEMGLDQYLDRCNACCHRYCNDDQETECLSTCAGQFWVLYEQCCYAMCTQ
jgi:hypothetical protein